MAKSSFTKPAPAGGKATPPVKAPAPGKPVAPPKAGAKTPPAKPTPGKSAAPPAKAPANKPAPPQRQTRPAPPAKREEAAPEFEPGERPGETEVIPPGHEEPTAGEGELAPAVINNLMTQPVGTFAGEMMPGDFEIPKFKLSQAVGPLADAGFDPGQLILNMVCILWAEGCEAVEITIIKAEKKYVEETEYGSDEFGQVFETAAEAQAAGLSTEWGPSGEKPQVLPQVLAMILIKKPEGVDPDEFPIEGPDGNLYAVALWRIAGTAYGLVRVITGAQRTRLKDGLHTGTFLVAARKEVGKKNTYFVPTLSAGSPHDDAFIQFVLEHAGS